MKGREVRSVEIDREELFVGERKESSRQTICSYGGVRRRGNSRGQRGRAVKGRRKLLWVVLVCAFYFDGTCCLRTQ